MIAAGRYHVTCLSRRYARCTCSASLRLVDQFPVRPSASSRSRHCSFSSFRDDDKSGKTDKKYDTAKEEDLRKLNSASVRLYRILMKQCRDITLRLEDCSNESDRNDKMDKKRHYILLQPPLDPIEYGKARMIRTSHSPFATQHEDVSSKDANRDTNHDDHDHDFAVTMSILHFFEQHSNSRNSGQNDADDMNLLTFLAPYLIRDEKNRHSTSLKSTIMKSHYSSIFGDNGNDILRDDSSTSSSSSDSSDSSSDDSDGDTSSDDQYYNDDDDDDDDDVEEDKSLLVTPSQLHDAIQNVFVRSTGYFSSTSSSSSSSSSSTLNKLKKSLSKRDIIQLQQYAIRAATLLRQQIEMLTTTSVTMDYEKGLRVVATSRCIGTSTPGRAMLAHGSSPQMKNRFAYRIRVENIKYAPPKKKKTKKSTQQTSAVSSEKEHEKKNLYVVQLLGRTWQIKENDDHDDQEGEVVTVRAPTTGAVGYLPVIKPGQAFEYMSGCEIATRTGTMEGCFHMAIVDEDTEPAMVGDPIETFHLGKEKKFEMPVGPFPLIADK